MGAVILDWRSSADYTRLQTHKRARFDEHGVVMRDPRDVTALTIHITGCRFGAGRAAIKKHGSAPDAIHDRARGIPAHATLFRDAVAVVPFDLRALLWHGNGFNPSSLGLEIECLGDRDPMPREQIDAAIETIGWLVEQAAIEGMRIVDVYAHRQSNGAKPGDPGPGAWREIVRPAAARYGLAMHPDVALPASTRGGADGLPIPPSWLA